MVDLAGNLGPLANQVVTLDIIPPAVTEHTADLSSSDLARLLQSNNYPQFADGTEALVLADGTLSIGADTNAFWGTLLRTASKAAITQAILGSAEYHVTHTDQDDTQFVNVLYQTMLGRSAETSGLSFWTQALAAGMSRGDAAAGIADSPEAKQYWSGVTSQGVFAYDPSAAIVREDYHTAFAREAETGGLTWWTNLLKNGVTPTQLAQDLTMSPEFQARHALQSDAQYVESLYEAGLGRQAEQAGAQY